MKRAVLLFSMLTAAGCGGHPQQVATLDQNKHVISLSQNMAPAGAVSQDAAPPVRELFRVDVYQFTLPIGTLSRNEDLWKRMDEQCVDVGTYDLLFKNGIRLGVAPTTEMDAIRKHLDTADLAGRKQCITGEAAKEVKLDTRKELMEQTIFYYDGQNNAVGRSYDRCVNLMNLSFEPTPRKPGAVRVKLCPMVRANRVRLEFTPMNEPQEIQFVSPEMLYDLNMRVDVPPGDMLLLTPSEDAKRTTSIGHAFMTKDSPTELLEQVIVIVPRPLVTP